MSTKMHGPGATWVQTQEASWRRSSERVAVGPLLSLLLLIDITFIAVQLWLWSRGQPSGQFNMELDGSIPEWFNYLKWLTSAVACAYVFSRKSEPLYIVWAMLFAYFLLDDRNGIHEQLGGELMTAFDLGPALMLRGQDVGELAVSVTVGLVLFGVMALLYRQTDNDSDARGFTRRLLPWLGVLIFFGVGVDMLHIQIFNFGFPVLAALCGFIEDGGEMIAASFLTVTSLRHALS